MDLFNTALLVGPSGGMHVREEDAEEAAEWEARWQLLQAQGTTEDSEEEEVLV